MEDGGKDRTQERHLLSTLQSYHDKKKKKNSRGPQNMT